MRSPLVSSTNLTASAITVSVRRPRKSIFSRPSSSRVVMVNCVVTEPSLPLDRGTKLSADSGQMTTPAACMEVCLGSPSRRLHMSIRWRTCSSS